MPLAFPVSLRVLLVTGAVLAAGTLLQAQTNGSNPRLDRALRHSDVQWISIAPHLPDPATATAAELESAADILRARRLPEDALEYYGYALARGGNASRLVMKQGISELEMQNVTLARAMFKRAAKLDPKNPEAWNNLAATEYLQLELGRSVSDYKRAVKLSANVATFHSNLGTALFEQKSYKKAAEQYAIAMRLDPDVFERHSGGGVMAHMLSPGDRGRFCYEVAKLALSRGDEAEMLHWLTKAVESGFDVKAAMATDSQMAKYRDDPRVAVLTKSTKAMHTMQVGSLGSVPVLPSDAAKQP